MAERGSNRLPSQAALTTVPGPPPPPGDRLKNIYIMLVYRLPDIGSTSRVRWDMFFCFQQGDIYHQVTGKHNLLSQDCLLDMRRRQQTNIKQHQVNIL